MTKPSAVDATMLFADGGEMGERLAAIDWSQSSLGPVEQWPQSLRTCVRIILTSRQPMFVWWGNDLINLYNDAYKSIVGGKHPEALGQPASVVWREIWEQVGPRAEASMQRNRGTYDEALLLIMERNGYPEETYYTFSYSPVPNDQGGIGGIICANTDDTARIIGERRIGLLRDLALRTAEARTCEDAARDGAEALETNPCDLPFALVYLASAAGDELVLAGCAGIDRSHVAAPERIAIDDATALWPAAHALRTHAPVLVESTKGALGNLPRGLWDKPAKQVAVIPLAASGESGRAGVLVVGLNPYRLYDDAYKSFLDLVARQLASAIANAQAYETEKRRAETLAELDRAKTTFFSNVSHEFRTPLTLMLGPVEDALASDAKTLGGSSLATVHRNAMRLLKLVNTLLDFARIEAGRAQASYAPTDLSALTTDLASAFRAAIERAGLKFVVDCPPLPEPIFVDHDMWEKIVLNLLSNAFKFTFEGSIGVALRWCGDHAELTIRDTGSGIAATQLPHLFERFHRVQGTRSRTHEGSGIGLALVHELVRLHGGTVSVESELGRGTAFTISVPRSNAHLPAERVDAARPLASTALGAAPFVQEAMRWLPEAPSGAFDASPSSSVSSSRIAVAEGRILLADDNADMRDYVARILRARWTVEAVADGADALAAARRTKPDIILTDVMMPGLDGFALLRALRADSETRGIPVIMLSARAGEESRVEGLEAGADDYLVKPFSARELTARVATHLQLAKLRTSIEAERNALKRLLATAPAQITFLRGPDLVIEVAHPIAVARLGNRPIEGKPLLEAVPEFRDQPYAKLLQRVYETGEPVSGRDALVQLMTPDGPIDTFWNFDYRPVRDASGRIEGVMTCDIEVTEGVRARVALLENEERLERALEKLEDASRTKDEFLAMLGHELRNPLAPIVTAVHLMRLRDPSNAVAKEFLVIERQLKHLVRLVDDLLDVSRIARGKIDLDKRELELSRVVANAIEVASPLLEQYRHHLDVDVPAEGLLVDGDATRLAQVVSNLLTNAAKYTRPGGHIAVRARREGDEIVLLVIDDGIGIAAGTLPRVFDMFAQEQQSVDRSLGGLGLGLAIVKNLVELHGGRVAARSEGVDRGSEFEIRLPAAANASVRRPTPVSIPAPHPARAGAPRLRVLVVDDNVDAAEMLDVWLASHGHEVRLAHDGVAAIAVARDFLPDVVLLDIGLPVMDGYEVAGKIRETRELAGACIVAVTGYGQAIDRERTAAAGFNRHIVKPISFDELADVVATRMSERTAAKRD